MSSTRRTFFLSVATAARLLAQEDVPLFRSEVALVKVDARVSLPNGSDVGGLTSADFVVLDEGAPQKITHFASESDPVNVMLVLDVSPSMRKSLADLSARAGQALDRLRPSDRVGVLLFAARTEWLQALTTEVKPIPRKIIGSIFRTSLGDATYLNQALLEAARGLGKEAPAGRRALVVVTDNETTHETTSEAEVLKQLHAADAVMNAILLGEATEPRVTPVRYGDPQGQLPDVRRYAKATGGDVYSGMAPERALDTILAGAATRYSIHYGAPPAEPGSFRRIRLDLSEGARRRFPDAVVQARSGYTTGS